MVIMNPFTGSKKMSCCGPTAFYVLKRKAFLYRIFLKCTLCLRRTTYGFVIQEISLYRYSLQRDTNI